jgi:hypothetical protein
VLNYVTEDGRAVEDEVSADTFEAALRTRTIACCRSDSFPFDVLVADLDRLGMDTVTAFRLPWKLGRRRSDHRDLS